MPPNLTPYRFPQYGAGFQGEDSSEGVTDETFQNGLMKECRNYHLVGRGRLLERRGDQPYIAGAFVAGEAIQGLFDYEFGTSRHLIGVGGGKIKRANGAVWTDITGGLSPTSGADHFARFTQFRQEGSDYLVGSGPNNTVLWRWDGSGNATALSGGINPPPAYAADVVAFRGHLFAINTNALHGAMATQYSAEMDMESWPAENLFYADPGSVGVGLAAHSKRTLLVFHQKSIQGIYYSYENGVGRWATNPVDPTVGCSSTGSIASHRGVTYFAADDGPYMIKDPARGAQYIGRRLEGFWAKLNKSRIKYIRTFARGEPWNEVAFLVSVGSSTQHNAVLVWQTELEDWTIFDSPNGYLLANCGISTKDTNDQHNTVLGRYDGMIHEAWGDEERDTGVRDGGSSGAFVETNMTSGFIDLGWPGLKRIKKTWIDIQIQDQRQFTLTLTGIADNPATTKAVDIGAAGARLGIDFIFGSSRFASDNPTQAQIRKIVKARLFQFSLTQGGGGPPHTINSLTFMHKRLGMRIKSLAS